MSFENKLLKTHVISYHTVGAVYYHDGVVNYRDVIYYCTDGVVSMQMAERKNIVNRKRITG